MENLMKIANLYINSINEEEEKLKDALKLINVRRECFRHVFDSINLSKLNDVFESLKLELEFITIHQTGETSEDFKNNGIVIPMRARPLDGCKIKPAIFNGFTSSGRSRNEKIRETKTKNLENKIFKLTGYKCKINKFSMEVKNGEPLSIMIDLFIPNTVTVK